jgi:transposase
MRMIREVLRLKHDCGLADRQIAESCKIGRTTVGDYIKRATQAGLSWPLPADLTELQLDAMLFKAPAAPASERPPPDCEYIYAELRRWRNKVNLTLTQLWIEYQEQHPGGYEYTQFCEHYRRWLGRRDYCMRQEHRAGEKLFVDYCEGLDIVDPQTGEVVKTQLFAAVWGHSNCTYVEASLTQTLPDWIGSHVRAFEYFKCAPHVVTPDNLKSGVTKACFYEPEINPTYADLAAHYGCAVLPAKIRKPRYKAKVEGGVLIVQRWILAVLRHRVFHGVAELNVAIWELLERLNARKLRKLKLSRREIFESADRPNAKPLPAGPYEFAEWKKVRVHIDHHVQVDFHYYSVPYRLRKEQLDARATAGVIEIFHRGERVTAHARSRVPYGYTTIPEHLPPALREYAGWTPARMIEWAAKIGPSTAMTAEKIMAGKQHPEQGYRACLGILTSLVDSYGAQRVEAACGRALKFNTCSFQSVRSILKSGLDRQNGEAATTQTTLPFHGNIRGGQYYN